MTDADEFVGSQLDESPLASSLRELVADCIEVRRQGRRSALQIWPIASSPPPPSPFLLIQCEISSIFNFWSAPSISSFFFLFFCLFFCFQIITEEFGSRAVNALLRASQRCLGHGAAAMAQGDANWWRWAEAAVNALGHMAESILQDIKTPKLVPMIMMIP